jgi:glycine C-acetyltransferase/8-amino-7-oxononanoate synthase
MASHTKAELRESAQVLGRAALQAGWRPGEGVPVAAAREAAAAKSDAPFDIERQAA